MPHLVAQDRDAGLFVMEYLDPARYPNWKSQLRDGVLREETARAVAERLVAIHAATAGRADIAAEFDTGDCFYAIRLEPYLIATARVRTRISRRNWKRCRPKRWRPNARWCMATSARKIS